MLVAIDCGNTHTVIGLFSDREIIDHWRIATISERTSDELALTRLPGTTLRAEGLALQKGDIDQLLAFARRLVIRGDAGSGKSTLLQWLAVRSAGRSFSGLPYLAISATFIALITILPDGVNGRLWGVVAGEMPSFVIAELLGLPLDDGRRLYRLTETIHAAPESQPEGAALGAVLEMFNGEIKRGLIMATMVPTSRISNRSPKSFFMRVPCPPPAT